MGSGEAVNCDRATVQRLTAPQLAALYERVEKERAVSGALFAFSHHQSETWLLFGRALSQYERQTMERAYKSTMEGHGVMDATIVWML